ncbi:MAG TPA: hypothetical protein PLI45_03380 [Candidatus Woesebacteria bacterium]|nr:hypothetical protein [Candidatus Woesebacteria bacterium]
MSTNLSYISPKDPAKTISPPGYLKLGFPITLPSLSTVGLISTPINPAFIGISLQCFGTSMKIIIVSVFFQMLSTFLHITLWNLL